MQYFDISIAPGEGRMIDVRGKYVYFLEGGAGGADATIAMRNQSGSETVLLKPGQAVRLGEIAGSYTRWVISNHKGQATINGMLLIGEGEFFDNRVSGSVEVVDGGRARTAANMAFMGRFACGGEEGKFANAQLWNPVNSNRILVVEKLMLTTNISSGYYVGSDVAPLASLLASQGQSKKLGGPGPVAQSRFETRATFANPGELSAGNLAANVPIVFELREPILIMPGHGLNLVAAAVEQGINGTAEWFEESI